MVGAFTERKREALTENRKRAKEMRHAPVNTEKLFWSEVRNRKLGGFKFKRQVPIAGYIVDFVCLEEKLIVELDGPLHRAGYHVIRDARLRRLGYRMLRFTNDEVCGDFAFVCAIILHSLRGGTPSP